MVVLMSSVTGAINASKVKGGLGPKVPAQRPKPRRFFHWT